MKEFRTLCRDLREVGLQIDVRSGQAQSLLIFAKAPKDLLGITVYQSRCVELAGARPVACIIADNAITG